MYALRVVLGSIFWAVMVLGCEPSAPGGGTTLVPGKDFTKLAEFSSKGGEVCTKGDGVCVGFPEGAVDSGQKVTVSARVLTPTQVSAGTTVGKIYEFKAEAIGQDGKPSVQETFKKPISLTFSVPAGKEKEELAVAYFQVREKGKFGNWARPAGKFGNWARSPKTAGKFGNWANVPSSAVKGGKARLGTTNHFSSWTLIAACPDAKVRCFGICVDLNTDASNCGACDQKCASGERCQAGTCVKPCEAGKSDCSGRCVDLNTDASNCGTCGTKCASGEACEAGKCVATPFTAADIQDAMKQPEARCYADDPTGAWSKQLDPQATPDPSSAARFSGVIYKKNGAFFVVGVASGRVSSGMLYVAIVGCGSDLIVEPAKRKGCLKETKLDKARYDALNVVASSCSSKCNVPEINCYGTCVDTQTDPNHCGKCGAACQSGEECKAGKCVLHCSSPMTDCGGTCVNLNEDPNHCGTCGNACSSGKGACLQGKCQPVCFPPKDTLCHGVCVDLLSDPSNCGTCGKVCGTTKICVKGGCQSGGCQTDADCQTNQKCVSGTCQPSCSQGLTNCNGTCVDTQTDPNHCGGCGKVCTTTCDAGTCI